MLKEKLNGYHVILASGSPRRQQFLKDLNIAFEIRLKPLDEVYPQHLKKSEITDYLSKLKATPFAEELRPKDVLITSDTIVWHNGIALGKPKNNQDAFHMISSLSDQTHEVISSICITTTEQQLVLNTSTKVTFRALKDDEIWYYINKFQPLDKAGAYGIQEWIGAVAITEIEGSYNNVVGLPTHLLYKTLNDMVTTP